MEIDKRQVIYLTFLDWFRSPLKDNTRWGINNNNITLISVQAYFALCSKTEVECLDP